MIDAMPILDAANASADVAVPLTQGLMTFAVGFDLDAAQTVQPVPLNVIWAMDALVAASKAARAASLARHAADFRVMLGLFLAMTFFAWRWMRDTFKLKCEIRELAADKSDAEEQLQEQVQATWRVIDALNQHRPNAAYCEAARAVEGWQ